MKNSKVSHIMNKSLAYIKNKHPIKFLTDVFQNYTKPLHTWEQSKALVLSNQSSSVPDVIAKKPPSRPESQKMVLSAYKNSDSISLKSNPCVSSKNINNSKERVKEIWSNKRFGKSASSVSLSKKSAEMDVKIRDKLSSIPVQLKTTNKYIRPQKIGVKREYPWQNFNIDFHKTSKYNRVKYVNNLTSEFLAKKANALKVKSNNKAESARNSLAKEVRGNKTIPSLLYNKKTLNDSKQYNFLNKAKLLEEIKAASVSKTPSTYLPATRVEENISSQKDALLPTTEPNESPDKPVLPEPNLANTETYLPVPASKFMEKPRLADELIAKSVYCRKYIKDREISPARSRVTTGLFRKY